MPRKTPAKKTVLPISPPPPEVLEDAPEKGAIERPPFLASHLMQRLATLLMNGARYQNSNFTAHTTLSNMLYTALNQNNPEKFLAHLRTYLVQARYVLPHVGSEEDQEHILAEVKLYIEDPKVGFQTVGRYIVRALYAPVDRV